MRAVRLRTTLTCAVLASAVIAGTTVSTASASVAPHSHSAQSVAPKVGLPDPTTLLGVLGALGGVTQAVSKLVAGATATPPLSPDALKALQDGLAGAVKALTSALPAPPLPIPGTSSAVKAHHLPIPAPPLPLPLPVPIPVSVTDALATLQKDATALIAAVTSLDPTKITAALTTLAADTLAVVTATVAALTTGLPA